MFSDTLTKVTYRDFKHETYIASTKGRLSGLQTLACILEFE